GPVLVPAVLPEVALVALAGLLDPGDELLVLGERLQLLDRCRGQHGDRIGADGDPPLRVDALEDIAQWRVPAPAQVHREIAERGDAGREDGADAEATDGLHEASS